jgi:hypothetical protein
MRQSELCRYGVNQLDADRQAAPTKQRKVASGQVYVEYLALR